ncbi:MAG TPA: hypothetical protein VMU95_17565 [Trebonia sp.]|nr:hypothetical protein [Trebonia sp.]
MNEQSSGVVAVPLAVKKMDRVPLAGTTSEYAAGCSSRMWLLTYPAALEEKAVTWSEGSATTTCQPEIAEKPAFTTVISPSNAPYHWKTTR